MVSVLRDRLLEDRAVVLGGGVPDPVRLALERLGARIELLGETEPIGEDEESVGEWARARAPLHAVVYDAGPAFGDGGRKGLTNAIERAWVTIREVVAGALIGAEEPGKVLLLGPRPGAGAHAGAARAALENLARTLSVEWARYRVTAAMLAPGDATTDAELAELVCFLVSPAGQYLSGCRLDLGTTKWG